MESTESASLKTDSHLVAIDYTSAVVKWWKAVCNPLRTKAHTIENPFEFFFLDDMWSLAESGAPPTPFPPRLEQVR